MFYIWVHSLRKNKKLFNRKGYWKGRRNKLIYGEANIKKSTIGTKTINLNVSTFTDIKKLKIIVVKISLNYIFITIKKFKN